MRTIDDIATGIAELEALLQPQLTRLTKLQRLLAGAKKKMSEPDLSGQDLKKFVADLRKATEAEPSTTTGPQIEAQVDSLCAGITGAIPAIVDTKTKEFWPALDEVAKKSGLRSGRVGGKDYLDVFEVAADAAKGVVALIYAKHIAASGISLQPDIVVKQAKKLGDEIRAWAESAKPEELGRRFDEAMSVALTRGGKPAQGGQKRVPLPELFREMQLVFQDRAKPLTPENVREYTMTHFVVDLRSLVTSEWNTRASPRFDLEPAVIENAGNTAKAVFIPEAIDAGYGEGKWWQALRAQ